MYSKEREKNPRWRVSKGRGHLLQQQKSESPKDYILMEKNPAKQRLGRNLRYLNLVLGGRRKTKFLLKIGTADRFSFWFVV